MGLMDRVKQQATILAQQAQEAAQEGKARLDQAQATRRGDAMLRQLGALIFAERTGRAAPDSQAKIDQLINDISAYERDNGLNLSDPSAGVPPQQGGPQPGSQGGPFGGSSPNAYGPSPFAGGGQSTPQNQDPTAGPGPW